MPFQSEKQRRYMHANLPEIANRWERDYANGGIARLGFAQGINPVGGIDQFAKEVLGLEQSAFPIGGTTHQVDELPGTLQDYYRNKIPNSITGYKYADKGLPGHSRIRVTQPLHQPTSPLGSATTEGLPSLDITGKAQSGFDTADFSQDIGNTNFFGEPIVDEEVVSRSFKDHDNLKDWLDANPQMGETMKQKARQFYESAKDVGRWGIDKTTAFKDMLLSGAGQLIDFPLAAFGKVANVVNPLSPQSRNYNPRLQSQVDYLSNRGMLSGSSGSSGPYKITSGALRGKNLVSGFGTNDYNKMLAKKQAWFQKRKDEKKSFSQKQWDKLKAEKKAADKQRAAAQIAAYSGPATTGYDEGAAASAGHYSGRGGSGSGPQSGSYGPWG